MAEPTAQEIEKALGLSAPETPEPETFQWQLPSTNPPAASTAPTREQLEAALFGASGDALSRAQSGAASLLSPSPTAADRRAAALTGAGVGGASGLTVGGGLVAGMQAGARLPLPPNLRGYAIAAGGVLGGIGGLTGSTYINKLLESAVPPRYLNDPALIPYYQGGKTFGEVIGAAPTLYGLPVMQGGRVANFISNMGTEVRAAPGAAATREFFSATGAGTLGGMALAYDPEAEGLRMVAEMVGGTFAPPKMLVTAAQNSRSLLGNIAARYSKGSREQMAADYLRDILEQAGDDPNKLVTRLREVRSGVTSPSAAQQTGSLALQVLETTLGKQNPAFASRIAAQGERSFRGYQSLLENQAFQNLSNGMRAVGDPEAIRLAADAERRWFSERLAERLTTAEQNAAQRIARIRVDSPETRASVGRIMQEEMENALADAREYERALWQQAELEAVDVQLGAQGLDDAVVTPRTLRARGSSAGILDAVTSVSPEYLRGMSGYNTVSQIMSRFGVNNKAMEAYEQGKLTTQYLRDGSVPSEYITNVKEVPVRDMVRARSDLLSLSRAAASSGDVNAARIYNEMAEAMMSDMDKLQLPAYDRAREYSRELNDFFTRTYARDLTASMRTGARKLPPEIIVARAFNTNNDITSQRMAQVMNSTGMLNARYQRLLSELGPDHPQVLELAPFAQRSADSLVSMADAQRQWLLLGANKALKPNPSRPSGVEVDRGQLDVFIAQNERYLRDAGLLEDLQDANRAESALRTVLDQNSAFNKGIKNQAAFALLLGKENPTAVVSNAITGNNPVRTMRRLSALARRGGPSAVAGFKTTLYDYAFAAAGGSRGNFSPTAYYDTLFEPLSRNQPSLIQFMTQSGMMTQMEKNNIRRLLIPMVQIENALANKQQLGEVLGGNASAVQDLALRVLGSKLGGLGGGSADSLVIAGAGSRIARDMFQNQPNILIKEVLEKVSENPQLMADMLERTTPNSPRSAELRRRLAAQLGISGFSAAIPALTNPFEYEPPADQPATGAFSAPAAPRPQPPAPATRGVPGVPAGGPQPAAPGPQAAVPGAPPGAQGASRDMLRQLFPFDTTLGLS